MPSLSHCEESLLRSKEIIQMTDVLAQGYLSETGTNSVRHVRIGPHTFLVMRIYETGLTMNSDRSDFASIAGPRREILVPVSRQISDRVQKFQACMLLGQPYIHSIKHIISSRNQTPSISSRLHVNRYKNFVPASSCRPEFVPVSCKYQAW